MEDEEQNWIPLPDQEANDSVQQESQEAIQDQNNEYRENCE